MKELMPHTSRPTRRLEPGEVTHPWLPRERTTFVGRKDELDAISKKLRKNGHLALIGPPGVGKSRLALRFAHRWQERDLERRAALYVDLRNVTEVEALHEAVALKLDVTLSKDDQVEEQLIRALEQRGIALLVLDNIDALQDEVLRWSSALKACGFQYLLTTRTVPEGLETFDVAPLQVRDAVELLSERARRFDPGFSVDEDQAMQRLVERLDRVPLSLELAASRLAVLSPMELLNWLDHDLSSLLSHETSSDSQVDPALEWSWEGLSSEQKTLLMEMSTFRVPFDIEDALEVTSIRGDVVDVLTHLTMRSLIHRVDGTGPSRFVLLESIRDFARRKLLESSMESEVIRRHIQWRIEQFTNWEEDIHGENASWWRRAIRIKLPDIEAIARQCLDIEPSLCARALFCFEALADVLSLREQLRIARLLFQAAQQSKDPALLMRAARVRASIELTRANLERCREFLDQAQARANQLQSSRELIRCLHIEGQVLEAQGLFEEAENRYQDALKRASAENDMLMASRIAQTSASAWASRGEYRRAAELQEEAMEWAGRLAGDEALIEPRAAIVPAYFYCGRYADALRASEQLLEWIQTLDPLVRDPHVEAEIKVKHATVLVEVGRHEEARRFIDESAEVLENFQDHRTVLFLEIQKARIDLEDRRLRERAERRLRQVFRDAERYKLRRAHVSAGVFLGISRLLQGDRAEARRLLERVLELAAPASEHYWARMCALFIAYIGLIEGKTETTTAFDRIREEMAAKEFAIDESLFAWLGAGRFVGRAYQALSVSANLDEFGQRTGELLGRMERLELRLGAPQTWAGRMAQAVIHADAETLQHEASVRSIKVVAVEEEVGPVLKLGPGGTWFEYDDHERVDIARRRALPRLLEALARHSRNEPIDIWDLAEAGWPDEEIHPEAAANRIYSSIRRLRELGLEEVIITLGDGYALAPEIVVEFSGA